ncbi:glycoside hydrolase family 76 protein [Xylariaceae sp. FL0016]|nr:glycoside hydrolase family 76 protein [Xylariaceae sp. FL0016]
MLQSLVSLFTFSPLAVFAALQADLNSPDSIKTAASQVAEDLLTYYHGRDPGRTLGILDGPPPNGDYYWWEAGALWGCMIDYWYWTGDDTYNDIVSQALLAQVGPHDDFQNDNWTASLGNDDQGFWGMAALTAAETNFPNPPADQPQWLALAQAVWNEQTDEDQRGQECGGGLRWQKSTFNNGWDYKNTISNGIFFNMGARLARYTKNDTYAQWAEDTWDWLVNDVKYVDTVYNVYDGGHIEDNCTTVNRQQFSYNAAVLILGAAHMYNYTNGSQAWEDRVNGLFQGIENVFFPNGTAYEVACEAGICKTDMLSFKGFTHRWLAISTQLAPFLTERVMNLLQSSTQAAVNQCTGGSNGRQCGFHWTTGVFDGQLGAGQQMNVVGALSSLLIADAAAPLTNETGGTSVGDPDAGTDSSPSKARPISTGDRAGASILTALFLGSSMAGMAWMVWK